MRKTSSPIAVMIFLSQNLFAAGPWTNEPAGAHSFLDCPFNSLGDCRITGPGGAITVDATAPVSPSNVFKSTLAPGASTGGSEIHYYTPQINRELFVGLMWRTNPQFEGRPQGNKLFFVRGPGSNGVFNFNAGPLANGTGVMVWGANTSGTNNGHVCGGDAFGATCSPNAGNGTLRTGVWTKLEAYVKASTTMTSRDGIVKWWINGVLVGKYENLNYASAGLREWVWSETWDGYVNPVPTVEWAHFVDHLYVSAPNFVLSLPKIKNDTIPSLAQGGKSYTAYLTATAEYGPISWTISSGSLPAGLSLGEKTGVISGIPNTCGLHNFTVKLTDANQSVATKNFSLNVTGTCTGTLVSGKILQSSGDLFGVRASAGTVTFNFPSPQKGQYQLSIYNLSGKEVYACRGAGQNEIKIKPWLSNGVYVAKCRQGLRTSTARFSVME